MYPRYLTTHYFVLHTFGLFLAIAYLSAAWWLFRSARREGLKREQISGLGLWVIIGAILGAKALMIIRTLPDYIENPVSILALQAAGDFYGGFIGAVMAALVYFARHRDFPRWKTADLCAPAIALGQAIGRIGCFMAGDDYGRPAQVPWAVTFTNPEAAEIGGAPLGIPLHPVQLYESLACLALFFFLVWLARRKRFDGEIILTYSMLYATVRFVLENFRGDVDRGFVFSGLLSTSQFIAILIILMCLPVYVRRLKHAPPSARPNREPLH